MEDELAPARGLVNGCMFSLVIWAIIAAIVYWATK